MARRLRALNWIAAVAFTIGGSLFAAGAAVAQLGSGADLTPACIYFAGGVFFNTGGYTALLQAINSPRGLAGDGSPVYERWALVVIRARADRVGQRSHTVRRHDRALVDNFRRSDHSGGSESALDDLHHHPASIGVLSYLIARPSTAEEDHGLTPARALFSEGQRRRAHRPAYVR